MLLGIPSSVCVQSYGTWDAVLAGDRRQLLRTRYHARQTYPFHPLWVSFQNTTMKSFLFPPRWNLRYRRVLAAHIFIRLFFFFEDKASSVSNMKRHFNAISLTYSPVLFPSHVHIIHSNTRSYFFLNSVAFKPGRPWWKWSGRISQKYCFFGRALAPHPNRLKESSVCPHSAPRRGACLPLFLIKIPSSGVLERWNRNKVAFCFVFLFSHW